jgi:ABC-type transporter Mla MlaB component
MTTRKAKRKRAAEPSSQPTIVLASNCSVKDAAELKQSLCAHLEESATVALNVGSVERVDTSTMQLLCAFVRDRAAQQLKVEWLGDSSVVRDAARLLGVEALLGLPPAGAAT